MCARYTCVKIGQLPFFNVFMASAALYIFVLSTFVPFFANIACYTRCSVHHSFCCWLLCAKHVTPFVLSHTFGLSLCLFLPLYVKPVCWTIILFMKFCTHLYPNMPLLIGAKKFNVNFISLQDLFSEFQVLKFPSKLLMMDFMVRTQERFSSVDFSMMVISVQVS